MSDASVSTMDGIKFTGVYPKGSLLFVEGEQPRGVRLGPASAIETELGAAEGSAVAARPTRRGR